MNSFHETLRFTAHALISPVHAVVGFFAPWEKDHKLVGLGQTLTVTTEPKPTQSTAGQPRALHRAANQAQFAVDRTMLPPHARRHVRVSRVIDTAIPASSAGRMVISGRLSEVCAELDRLSCQGAMSDRNPEVA